MGKVHLKTHLHRDGEYGGHVLLPFASNRFDVNGIPLIDAEGKPDDRLIQYSKTIPEKTAFDEASFIPDTSQWSHYYIVISGSIESLNLANPTVGTVGVPLFFELLNNRSDPVTVIFGTKVDKKYESEYDAGERIVLPSYKVVSGILLFDERNQWTLHAPWTCRGAPLYLLSQGVGPSIPSDATIRPTHHIHHITDKKDISEIIPPVGFAGELILIPEGEWKTVLGGNIKNAITAVVDRPVRCIYDSITKKWYLVA